MIDCEAKVLTRVAEAVHALFPSCTVKSEYPRNIKDFPHIYLVMSDNPINTQRTSDTEYALPMFTIEIYTMGQGKRTEAKKIASVVDDEMYSMNFERTAMTEVPNLEDATINRLVLRYQGETDGTFFYRR